MDLLAERQAVKNVAAGLNLSRSTVYGWRQARSLQTTQQKASRQAELTTTRERIAELEKELLSHRRRTTTLSETMPPASRFDVIRAMTSEGHQVRSTAALLRVSESGYYAWSRRSPSQRALRHTRLSELVLSIYQSSRTMYGSRRIHQELQHCYGISISRGTVELLMRQAGIQGRAGRTQRTNEQTLDSRTAKRLWVADARAHPTSTVALYSAIVLDTNLHRLTAWSLNQAATHELLHKALNTALTRDANQLPPARSHHPPLTAYAFTERMRILMLAPVSSRAPDPYAQASVEKFWKKVGHSLQPTQQGDTTEILKERPEDILEELAE
ncbi:IS3 family transposase [Streptomyces sp. NPDC005529]|uniref:IS3 family transposase n=1 Tax=unclassified Streptomyces TaxID=2593676 RepID=UPI0033BF00B2